MLYCKGNSKQLILFEIIKLLRQWNQIKKRKVMKTYQSDLNLETMSWKIEILDEFAFTFARSSGSGGQHVNKVETKVYLSFDLKASKLFSNEQAQMLVSRLQKYLTKDCQLKLSTQRSRSQLKNRELVTAKAIALIEAALIVQKKRKPLKISKEKKEKRLLSKKRIAEKKSFRKKLNFTF